MFSQEQRRKFSFVDDMRDDESGTLQNIPFLVRKSMRHSRKWRGWKKLISGFLIIFPWKSFFKGRESETWDTFFEGVKLISSLSGVIELFSIFLSKVVKGKWRSSYSILWHRIPGMPSTVKSILSQETVLYYLESFEYLHYDRYWCLEW